MNTKRKSDRSTALLSLESASPTPELSQNNEWEENNLYLYDEVNTATCERLVKNIKETDALLTAERIMRGLDTFGIPKIPILLHIHSDGGDLLGALAVIDAIQLSNTPVYSIIEGYAASAASLISVSCHKRFITKNSHMLIHGLRSEFWGTHADFIEEVEFQKKLQNSIAQIYASHSNMNTDTVINMLNKDNWLNASETVNFGLCDQILGELE